MYIPLSRSIGIITYDSEYYFDARQPLYKEVTIVFPPTININVFALDINNVKMINVYFELHLISNNQTITYRGFTNSDGVLKLLNVLEGNYTVVASFKDLVQDGTFSINNMTKDYSLKFFISFTNYNQLDFLHLNAFRNIKIENPSQYVQTFLQSTFSIITMIIGVFITIFLMFLSMESIITFPLYQHRSDINTLRLIGASNQQISLVVSLKLAIYSFIGSLLGILSSNIVLFSVSSVGNSNFGGLIFSPKFSPSLTLLSVLFIFVMTFIISYLYLLRSLLPSFSKRM